MPAATTASSVGHPLEPLTAEEIAAATSILKRDRKLTGDARFVTVSLTEPDKAEVLAFKIGQPIDRQAKIVLRDRSERLMYEAVVSVTRDQVVSWKPVPGAQPALMTEEIIAQEEIIKKDPRFIEALRKRGVTDLDLVMCDAWTLGYNEPKDGPEKGRFTRPLSWVRTDPDDNGYARPIEGVVVRFDLDRMAVVEVADYGATPVPPRSANYSPQRIRDPLNVPHFPDGPRADVKPLEIAQPMGPSVEVDGHHVTWQKWDLRVGFTPREGLVLHTVQYRDGGELRPIIYRASLSELFVPYGDSRPTRNVLNAFDVGEFGVGSHLNSLELGCDCLGEIRYFDAVVSDNNGDPKVLRNAICLHEEDSGILWKHLDRRTRKAEVRRSRRLVVSCIATMGNYEYGFFWYLYQDGTIEYEVKLTGIISTAAIAPGERPIHGALVAPGLYGPNHQHIFSVRLDMMVGGLNNTVEEVNSEAVPWGQANPRGNAWIDVTTKLDRESKARRRVDPVSARRWRIVNPNIRNELGEPIAYTLLPGENCVPFYQPDANAIRRAQFATQHLWVTAFDPNQMFAAGDYPNQHPGGDGLPAYQSGDRELEDTDVVVWYTFGKHHVPRPEDWPVMPVATIGFHLKPTGFFVGNPSLDNPVSEHDTHGAIHDVDHHTGH